MPSLSPYVWCSLSFCVWPPPWTQPLPQLSKRHSQKQLWSIVYTLERTDGMLSLLRLAGLKGLASKRERIKVGEHCLVQDGPWPPQIIHGCALYTLPPEANIQWTSSRWGKKVMKKMNDLSKTFTVKVIPESQWVYGNQFKWGNSGIQNVFEGFIVWGKVGIPKSNTPMNITEEVNVKVIEKRLECNSSLAWWKRVFTVVLLTWMLTRDELDEWKHKQNYAFTVVKIILYILQ